jgi:hypothetical protein
MTKAVEYDYTQLVIAAFGCAEPVFNVESCSVDEEKADIAGSGGWTRVDAIISANGCAHNFKSDKMSYLQYGRPMKEVKEDFAVIRLFGRVYAKYLEEYGCTVMIYVMAPDENTVAECDGDILHKAVIKGLQKSG